MNDNASDKGHDICNLKAAKCTTTFFSEVRCCDELSIKIFCLLGAKCTINLASNIIVWYYMKEKTQATL